MTIESNAECSLPPPEVASSGESSAPVASTTQACEAPPLKKIPIVFVPGVMGSRLQFPAIGEAWDPDSNWAMIHWVRISAERARRELRNTAAANVMPKASKLTDDEIKRGYAGLAADFYRDFVRFLHGQVRLEVKEKLQIDAPVHGVGYDWRQSNKVSADYLTKEVDRILDAEGASQVLLVTHSMGGIVTRSAMKSGLAGKVLGVIHIFQPVDGAVVLYRRFFTGAVSSLDGGTGMSLILGDTSEKFSTIMSGMPGPLQLLPTNAYKESGGKEWLTYIKAGATASWAGDVYDLYLGAACPPAVFPFETPPPGVSPVVGTDLRTNIALAKEFHADLAHYQHPKTKTIHATQLDTDMALLFDPPELAPNQVRFTLDDDGRTVDAWPNRGAQPERRAEGDGTVPDTSAAALAPQEFVTGVEHSAACASGAVRARVKDWIKELLS